MITVTKTIARKYNLINISTTVSNKKIIRRAIHNHYAIYYAKSLAIITIFEALESCARGLAIITTLNSIYKVTPSPL